MKQFDRDKVRAVGLFGAGGAGKTSFAEACAFTAGTYADWKNHRIYIVDTPGDANFHSEASNAIRAVDAAVFVIDAIDGVKVQTGKLWDEARELGIPKLIVITKPDRERANFM